MDADIFLTVGALLLLPTVPMIFNGLKEGVAPKFAFVMILLSFGLITVAFVQKPNGYDVNDIPGIMWDTIQRVF